MHDYRWTVLIYLAKRREGASCLGTNYLGKLLLKNHSHRRHHSSAHTGILIANIFNFNSAEFFEIDFAEQREVPKVEF